MMVVPVAMMLSSSLLFWLLLLCLLDGENCWRWNGETARLLLGGRCKESGAATANRSWNQKLGKGLGILETRANERKDVDKDVYGM
jgi:hypothetical protein